jgi:hypothetical protein
MSNQQSAAAANALSGEKSFRNVTFVVTGDPELDLISGITAMISEQPQYLHNPETIVRILQYLTARFQAMQRDRDRQAVSDQSLARQLREMQAQGVGAGVPNTNPYGSPNPFFGTTSGGNMDQANQSGVGASDYMRAKMQDYLAKQPVNIADLKYDPEIFSRMMKAKKASLSARGSAPLRSQS